VTKITKRETIEGELGRFMLHQGEDPQAMYNRLKTLMNQVHNLGSTKWDDHVSAFRPRGVPGSTSKLLLRVLAQMGRRETATQGGKIGEGKPRTRVVLRPGRMRLQ
jgi:hypothetical protein